MNLKQGHLYRDVIIKKNTSLGLLPNYRSFSFDTERDVGISVSGKSELNSIKNFTKSGTKTFHYQKDNTSGNHVAGELVPNLNSSADHRR